ncbi:hypothetical protein MHY87_17175 [Microvirga sp. ACRRW]|uniref:hypothetical protein n=1 Tax=Microvirga sp. ACRRW TaxID=2918205 RepID=UPI001EF6C9E5|nr:hypothetical protein [Microvirga sp. ACRRW]MCG7394639.1 hypothetical protein [Microvirga sp. ACRRW]
MARQLLAIFATSLACAYIIQLFDIAASGGFQINVFKTLIEILVLGTVIYLHFFIPLLLLSVLLVLFLAFLRCHSMHCSFFGGGLFGFSLVSGLVLAGIEQGWELPPLGGLCGAVCGWVYWLIATGGRPQTPTL